MYPSVPPIDDRAQLIREHMPMVDIIVQRMVPQVPSFMTRDDMTSAAMEGLFDAANKYDPAKGAGFKTFAEYRIRGSIFDEMRKLDWFSRSMREKYNQLTRTMLELERKLGQSPGEDEMAEAMDMSIDQYHDLLTKVSHLGCVSLNETLDHSSEGKSFLDSLEDRGCPTPLELIENQELAGIIAGILEKISEKERMVIALYYYEELTQREIAEIIGVTEGRVSQLHSQALLKIKIKMVSAGLDSGALL